MALARAAVVAIGHHRHIRWAVAASQDEAAYCIKASDEPNFFFSISASDAVKLLLKMRPSGCHWPFSSLLAKVFATRRGAMSVASAYTLTGLASTRILPQLTASSGLAPLSEPSNSWAVLT